MLVATKKTMAHMRRELKGRRNLQSLQLTADLQSTVGYILRCICI